MRWLKTTRVKTYRIIEPMPKKRFTIEKEFVKVRILRLITIITQLKICTPTDQKPSILPLGPAVYEVIAQDSTIIIACTQPVMNQVQKTIVLK